MADELQSLVYGRANSVRDEVTILLGDLFTQYDVGSHQYYTLKSTYGDAFARGACYMASEVRRRLTAILEATE